MSRRPRARVTSAYAEISGSLGRSRADLLGATLREWPPRICRITGAQIGQISDAIKHGHDFSWLWKAGSDAFGRLEGLLEGINVALRPHACLTGEIPANLALFEGPEELKHIRGDLRGDLGGDLAVALSAVVAGVVRVARHRAVLAKEA